MEGSLRSVREWADEWHSGSWSMARLPKLLGATLKFIPDWGRFLGTSFTDDDGKSSICVNEGLIGGDLFVPTMAHECGHILLNHKWLHPCIQMPDQSRGEQRAWRAAALLAIPTRAMEALLEGKAFPVDLAREYGVPPALVDLRYAMLKPPDDSCITRSLRIKHTDRFITWLSAQAQPAT